MKPALKPFAEKPLAAWLELFRSSPNAEERYRALQAVASLAKPDESIGWLQMGLDDADSAVRAGSARLLASRIELTPRPASAEEWKSVAERWAPLLNDDDPDVRFESACGLVELDPANTSAATVLAELLVDAETQPAMLAAILKTYRVIDPQALKSTPPWTRLLQHEQSIVREEAARTLGHWGSASSNLVQELVPQLEDEEPFVREEAAKALGAIGIAAPNIMAALETATTDEDEIVAETAKASLQKLREEPA
jgi:HEAT repeat protein